jgi:spermidine/putrescine transport system ATP-binding protein
MSDHVAVMNQGRFEQLGTPQELYYEPQTPFVAGFVGANNRIQGQATEVQGQLVSLVSAQGLVLRALSRHTVRPGDKVEAFVRPEVASISRTPGTFTDLGQLHCLGRVDSILFDGANSAVLLREEVSGLEFRIALPQTGQFSDLTVGETVSFGFDPRRAVCFSVPPTAPKNAD